MKTHNRSELASGGTFRVDRCSCGTINLHIGALTLRLEAAAMEQLSHVLSEASRVHRERFGSGYEPQHRERFGSEYEPQISPEVAEALVEEEIDLPLSLFDETDKTLH